MLLVGSTVEYKFSKGSGEVNISYKEMYEGQLAVNEKLQEKIWDLEDTLRQSEEEIDTLRNGYDGDLDDFVNEVMGGLRGV